MRPAESVLRKKCHDYIIKKDARYRSFEVIQMNEETGLVTIIWIDRFGDKQESRVPYGIM